jgi:hypothetical protein
MMMRVRAKDKSDQAGNPASELHFQLNSLKPIEAELWCPAH